MDFRVKLPKIRVVPPREERFRSLVQGADHAEAFTGKLLDKARPYAERVRVLRTRLATLAVALLAVWLFMHVTFGANGMVVYRAKRAEYQTLQKDIDRLQTENGDYTDQVTELKTDPKRIEKEAREQFHYARPGEVIYVAPDRPTPASPANHTASK
jgi:cell division protein FtsB